MTSKPRVFIASSKEGLKVAKAINASLDFDTTPTLWSSGTFRLGSSTLDDLAQKSSEVDFAIFVFTPDDVLEFREETARVVRDNVLFELGLFIGALGKTRCFIVQPRDTDMHIPTDLLGVNTTSYVADRPDNDLSSAVNYPCTQIQNDIANLGKISRVLGNSGASHIVANPPVLSMRDDDLRVLLECASSSLTYPAGVGFAHLCSKLKVSDAYVGLSIIKLSQLGYIDKSVELDHGGDAYYSYTITDNGMEALVAAEDKIMAFSGARTCLLYTSPSPRDQRGSRMPSSA